MVLFVETYWFDEYCSFPQIKNNKMTFSVRDYTYQDPFGGLQFGYLITLREEGNIRSQDKIEWIVG